MKEYVDGYEMNQLYACSPLLRLVPDPENRLWQHPHLQHRNNCNMNHNTLFQALHPDNDLQ